MTDEQTTEQMDEQTDEQTAEQTAEQADAREADQEAGDLGFKVIDRRFWTLNEEELAAEESKQPSKPTYIEQLESQLAQKDKQLREYIAAYKKEVVEELEQTRQRLEADAAQQRKKLVAELATPMMEVFEAFERSIQAAQATSSVEAVVEGVQLVQQLMLQKLKELGLERIETVGQPFDPSIHEAVAVMPVSDASQNNLIINEFAAGFCFDGRVFRPAKVQVGKLQ